MARPFHARGIGRLELVVRAENLHDLVDVHLLHALAGRGEVLARIEVTRILSEVLADRSRHRETRVGVDVDLAHGALRSLAELGLRNADGIRKLAAELVDRLDFVLRNAGRSVKDDREARKLLLDGLEDVESERRRNELAGLLVNRALLTRELIRAVAGADGDGERIATGLLGELDHLFRLRVVGLCGGDFVLNASENSELGLNRHVMLVGVRNDLLRELDVLLERKVGTVDHDARETAVDAALAGFIAVTVVEVKNDLGLFAAKFLGVFNRTLSHVAENRGVRILAGALGDLHDDGRLRLDRRLNDGLHLLHRVEVEGRNSISALDRLREHLLGVHESEFLVADHLYYFLFP